MLAAWIHTPLSLSKDILLVKTTSSGRLCMMTFNQTLDKVGLSQIRIICIFISNVRLSEVESDHHWTLAHNREINHLWNPTTINEKLLRPNFSTFHYDSNVALHNSFECILVLLFIFIKY